MKDVVVALKKIKNELLDCPSKWIKLTMARDNDDIVVHPTSPNAAKWCLVGAALAVSGDDILLYSAILHVIRISNDMNGVTGVTDWNDDSSRTHAQVINAINTAITYSF